MTRQRRSAKSRIASVFSSDGVALVHTLRYVLDSLGHYEYPFMPEAEFHSLIRQNPAEGSKIYWLEILYRAHFSAITPLLRSARWIDGLLAAHAESNLLAFAATYRGLIEAAADAQHAFGLVVPTLVAQHSGIRVAIAGIASSLADCKELEDALIHFMYARRLQKGEQAPTSHRARTTAEYLEILKRGCSNDVVQCYAEVCNFTHPAGPSILSYARESEAGSLLEYWPNADSARIAEFCHAYSPLGPEVLMFGINNGLVLLKVLNSFSQRSIFTPSAANVDLSGIPAWVKAERQIGQAS